jgi:hypothetical protein
MSLGLGLGIVIASTTPPPTITGGNVSVAGLATHNFSATGGTAPYTWSLQTNASSGAINSSTGVYTAGAVWSAATDVVKVTDVNSQTATVNVTLTVPVIPSVGSACKMQLDANQIAGGDISGGKCVNWRDQSGNGIVFTQSGAANQFVYTTNSVNTLPKLTANSSNSTKMTSSSTLAALITKTAWTIFIVSHYTGSRAETASPIYNNPGVITDAGAYMSICCDVTNMISEQFTTAAKSATVAKPTIIEVTTHYIDGTNIFIQAAQGAPVTGSALVSPSSTVLTNTLLLGVHNGGTIFYDGDICEILAYDTNLSSGDKLSIQKYLAAKWKNATS